MTTIDNMKDLRVELRKNPRARLDFAKVMTDFFASYDISVTSDLLGRLIVANCEEIEEILKKDGQDMDNGITLTWM